jgi:hypothetical protein
MALTGLELHELQNAFGIDHRRVARQILCGNVGHKLISNMYDVLAYSQVKPKGVGDGQISGHWLDTHGHFWLPCHLLKTANSFCGTVHGF